MLSFDARWDPSRTALVRSAMRNLYELDSTSTVYDLVGNVWEWQETCSSGECVAHGGSFTEGAGYNRCSTVRSFARETTASNIGFRCCNP